MNGANQVIPNLVMFVHKSYIFAAINNCFGYSIMSEKKRTTTKYKPYKELRKILMNGSPVVEIFEAGLPEQPNELLEITMRPRRVIQKTPIQIGAEVLSRGTVCFITNQ